MGENRGWLVVAMVALKGMLILYVCAHVGKCENCPSSSSTDTMRVRYNTPEVGHRLPSVKAIILYGINRTCKHTYMS